MAEDLFGNEVVADVPLTPATSRRVTNDMRQVMTVLERASTEDVGYMLGGGVSRRVYRRVDKDTARPVPQWEATVVHQLISGGQLTVGAGMRVMRSGAVRTGMTAVLVPKATRGLLTRWKALKQPTSWAADIS